MAYIKKRLAALDLYDVSIIFDRELPCGKGRIHTCGELPRIHDVTTIVIGVSELHLLGFDPEAFFACLKTVGHELRHVEQEQLHQYDTSYYAYRMALAYVCRMFSMEYYIQPFNYRHNVKELDAEYMGLHFAYDIFNTEWGVAAAEEQIKLFINKGVDARRSNINKAYFIPLNSYYHDSDSIFSALERRMVVSQHVHRHCPFWLDNAEYRQVCLTRDGTKQDEFLVKKFLGQDKDAKRFLLQNTPALQLL